MSTRHKDNTKELFNNLSKDFHEIVSNQALLRSSTEKFLNNLIDEITLGVIFDTHRKAKTRGFDLVGDSDGLEIDMGVDVEKFTQYKNIKKNQDCVCPYCERAIAATRFASHLEKCMVEGKSRQKNAARKLNLTNDTIKESDSSYKDSIQVMSDDEDDADWSPGDKRNKKRKDKNGKKRRGTPTKKSSSNSSIEAPDYLDTLNVDVGSADEAYNSLRELLQEQDLNSSGGYSSGGSRKKDKSRSRKKKESNYRRSPSCSSTSSLD